MNKKEKIKLYCHVKPKKFNQDSQTYIHTFKSEVNIKLVKIKKVQRLKLPHYLFLQLTTKHFDKITIPLFNVMKVFMVLQTSK